MRNIKQPVNRLLFNSLSSVDVGMYEDYKEGKKVMTFKKHGLQIYGDVYTGGAAAPATTGTLPSNLKVAKSVTTDGKTKVVLVESLAPAPCVACDWTYYLSFRERVKRPGVRNSKSNLQQRTYAGTLPVIESTSAVVDASYVLASEDDLITQITNDVGLHQVNQDPISKYAGAIVNAHRAYLITTTNNASDTVVLTSSAGVDETIDLDGGTTIITATNDFNDDNTLGLIAIPVSSTQMLVWGTAGDLYIATAGVQTTIAKRYMMFIQKDQNVQFDVIFEPGTYEQKGVHMWTLDASTVTTSAVTMMVDGVATTATAATSVANLAIELIADLTAAKGYAGIAATGSTDVIVYTDSTLVSSFSLSVSAASTVVVSTTIWHPLGQYPSLTSDDVFRVFANQKDLGGRSAFGRLDQPIADAAYVKYHIIVTGEEVSGLHGASYNATHESEFEIYVLASLISTDAWDITNIGANGLRYTFMDESSISGFVADTNFEELLGILTGVAPSLW